MGRELVWAAAWWALAACGGNSNADVVLDLASDEGAGEAGVDDAGEDMPPDMSPGTRIDLADIVGGGDGTGSGGDRGIDMLTGLAAPMRALALDCPANVYVPAENALVDGVFCPDGGEAEDAPVPIRSDGTTLTGVPDWAPSIFTQSTWDHLWNGTNSSIVTEFEGPQIGAHANKGITFDLAAIAAAHGTPVRFQATAGIGNRTPLAENVLSFLVAVDDAIVFEERGVSAPGSRFPIDVPIPAGATSLTLIAAASGDIQNDWSFWGAPILEVR